MDRFLINGGNRLEGEIKVDGSKNAVLPILAATIINKGESVIHNVPEIKDVDILTGVLKDIGCKCYFENGTLIVKSDTITDFNIPEKPVREMRSSIILLGAMISRCNQVRISYPGGCDTILTQNHQIINKKAVNNEKITLFTAFLISIAIFSFWNRNNCLHL